MKYDEMTMEELVEEQDLLIVNVGDIRNAIADIDKALNNLSDVGTDVINSIYDELEEIRNTLEDEATSIDLDLENIDEQMQILESMYDEYGERHREYREMQGF